MAIDFPPNAAQPNPPIDGEQYFDNASQTTWTYDANNNSWTLTSGGDSGGGASMYQGEHDFTQSTVPNPAAEAGYIYSQADLGGVAGTVDNVYNGIAGESIEEGALVLYTGSSWTFLISTPGYPDLGDGNGGTLDDRYVLTTGDNMTGDLTLGTDKITLETNGSGSFSNGVTASFLQTLSYDISSDAGTGSRLGTSSLNFQKPNTVAANSYGLRGYYGTKQVFGIRSDGGLTVIGDGDNASPTAKIGADGSGSFTNGVGVGLLTVSGNVTEEGARLRSNGVIQTRRDDGIAEVYNVFSGGSTVDFKTIKFLANGSADFAGKVTSASTEDVDSGTTLVTKDYVDAATGDGSTADLQTVTDNGNITTNGATFGSDVISGENPGSGVRDGVKLASNGFISVGRTSGTDNVFNCYTTGSSTKTIEFNADGTSNFRNVLNVGGRTVVNDKFGNEQIVMTGNNTSGPGTEFTLQNSGQGTDATNLITSVTRRSSVTGYSAKIEFNQNGDLSFGGKQPNIDPELLPDTTLHISHNGTIGIAGGDPVNTPSIKLTNTGTGTFAQDVYTYNWDSSSDVTSGTKVGNGIIDIQKISTATGNAIRLKQGTTDRFIVKGDGAVHVGGSTSTNPNIKLSQDGSAVFKGKVTSVSTESGDAGTTLVTKDYVDAAAGGGGDLDLQAVTDNGNSTTNGATFATLDSDGRVISGNSTVTGRFQAQAAAGSDPAATTPFVAYQAGASDASIITTYSGDAYFAGKVTSSLTESTDTDNTLTTKDYVDTWALWDAVPAGLTPKNSNQNLVLGDQVNTQSFIGIDGRAYFESNVESTFGITILNTSDVGYGLTVRAGENGVPLDVRKNDGQNIFQVVGNGTTFFNDTAQVLPDGTGDFQNLQARGKVTLGSDAYAGGVVCTAPFAAPEASSYILIANYNNDLRAVVDYAGNAYFTGDVTAGGNIGFALEPENTANYTTVTSEDGTEVSRYTGPVLDVKDRLQNLLTRLDALEANEIIDDATDSSLLQLISSATSRLDSIEARLAAAGI